MLTAVRRTVAVTLAVAGTAFAAAPALAAPVTVRTGSYAKPLTFAPSTTAR